MKPRITLNPVRHWHPADTQDWQCAGVIPGDPIPLMVYGRGPTPKAAYQQWKFICDDFTKRILLFKGRRSSIMWDMGGLRLPGLTPLTFGPSQKPPKPEPLPEWDC